MNQLHKRAALKNSVVDPNNFLIFLDFFYLNGNVLYFWNVMYICNWRGRCSHADAQMSSSALELNIMSLNSNPEKSLFPHRIPPQTVPREGRVAGGREGKCQSCERKVVAHIWQDFGKASVSFMKIMASAHVFVSWRVGFASAPWQSTKILEIDKRWVYRRWLERWAAKVRLALQKK